MLESLRSLEGVAAEEMLVSATLSGFIVATIGTSIAVYVDSDILIVICAIVIWILLTVLIAVLIAGFKRRNENMNGTQRKISKYDSVNKTQIILANNESSVVTMPIDRTRAELISIVAGRGPVITLYPYPVLTRFMLDNGLIEEVHGSDDDFKITRLGRHTIMAMPEFDGSLAI